MSDPDDGGLLSNTYRNHVVGATTNPVMRDPDAVDEEFALAANRALADSADIVRALVGAHQSAVAIVVSGDWSSMRKYFSMSAKYAAWADYATPAVGFGIHTMVLEQPAPVRLTQSQLEAHELWKGFGDEAGKHPPMRGWLAAPIRDRTGRTWGMVQLSDRYEGEFTAQDEQELVRFVDLLSLTLEALWELRNARKAGTAARGVDGGP